MVLTLIIAATLRLPDLAELPPGLHYDEAANGVLAADIGLRGDRPLFIASYTGKEVLFFYLAGGLMRLAGDSVLTLRLTAAFVGLLTIAATYWLGRELLWDRQVALLAAALLAVSFWHLLFSRLGFRAITQPLLQTLTVAALLRGMRRNQRSWLVASGVFLGLTAYTYLAARLFPLLLLAAAPPLLLDRQAHRRRWQQLLLIGLVGSLVLAPLLGYFISHPNAFWVRIGQVAPGASNGLSLGESYLRSLGMFFLEGDPYWRFNLPTRPLFNWFWGGLFVVGWAALLFRWRRFETDVGRMAALLLLLTPLVMILPTALATNEIVPSNLRAIGLIPFIFYLPASGLQTLLGDVEKRFNLSNAAAMMLVAGILVLTIGGWFTERAYFREWGAEPFLYFEVDGDLTAVAQFLDELDTDQKTIYVAARHYQHPTLAFLSQKYGQIKWLPESRALVYPAEGTAIYIFPANSPLPEWAAPYLETAVSLDGAPDVSGKPAFTAYEMAAPNSLGIPNIINANFDKAITLLGYRMGLVEDGNSLTLTLYWRIIDQPMADFMPFVHLEDQWKYRWEQAETFAYPAPQWEKGEIVIQHVELPMPPGAPPGIYRLRVGLFTQDTGERMARLDEDGRFAGDSIIIENVPIAASLPPDRLPQPPFVVDEQVNEGLRLLGYERGLKTVEVGETIHLGLWWLVGQPQPALVTRLELHPISGPGRILTNTQPVHGTYPFGNWTTPSFLIDHTDAVIQDDMLPGEYRLLLRILDADDETLFTTDLGPLLVTVSQRLFTTPPIQVPLNASFGSEIVLLGYDLETVDEREVGLTLVWQAETIPTDDYTVFVHLLDQDGGCCFWQADLMPQQNQYPTSRWRPGEVVLDNYQIALPAEAGPGEYEVEVGLYLAENGRRLQVTGSDFPDRDAVRFPIITAE